jgi:hypothetical protein
MRFALRKQNKIQEAYGEEYLTQHVLHSLEEFFDTHSDEEVTEAIELTGSITRNGTVYRILRINDTADDNCMLEFAVTGHAYDVIRLAFLGRMKG